ncbi:hypothetical protein [Variovorax sp.]|uniref:hypothetical protein n=1 Tax=Variovorax sp. TaxID=1871043 RepID=UPI003BA85B52
MSLITTKNAVVYIDGKRIEVPKGAPLPDKVSKEDIEALRDMGALPKEGAAASNAPPTPATAPAAPAAPATPEVAGKR